MHIYGRIILAVLAIILYSCSTDTVYHKYIPTKNDRWNKEDTLSFVISDSLDTAIYNTEIGIRHTEIYPYKDLWLSITYPNKVTSDTIHVYLANDRGNWNSSGSTGGYFQYSVQAGEFNYSSIGDSIIKINHIMNDSPLIGITDIGLKISRK